MPEELISTVPDEPSTLFNRIWTSLKGLFIAPYRPSHRSPLQYRPRRSTILLLLTTFILFSQWAYAYVEKKFRPLSYAESERVALVLSNHIDLATLSAPQDESMFSDVAYRGQIIGGTGHSQFDFPEYTVKAGDTLSGIAQRYNVTVEQILRINPELPRSAVIKKGQLVTIPREDASVEPEPTLVQRSQKAQIQTARTSASVVRTAVSSKGGFVMPVSYKVKTRGFSSYHPGSDLAADIGTPVVAARSGCVVLLGTIGRYNSGYGNFILMDVGEGLTTLSAHLSRYASGVKEGSCFSAGQIIGYVGSTGRSTGPHLHFEIRRNGVKIDPRILIPGI